jgi:hypothetical protein
MAGHSRPKDGVAALACVPAIHALLCDLGFVSPKCGMALSAVRVAEIASSRCALLAMTASTEPSASLRAKRSNLAACAEPKLVMAGLDPAIHALLRTKQGVDTRHKAGHDGGEFRCANFSIVIPSALP